jgi:hypothetical protein
MVFLVKELAVKTNSRNEQNVLMEGNKCIFQRAFGWNFLDALAGL